MNARNRGKVHENRKCINVRVCYRCISQNQTFDLRGGDHEQVLFVLVWEKQRKGGVISKVSAVMGVSKAVVLLHTLSGLI